MSADLVAVCSLVRGLRVPVEDDRGHGGPLGCTTRIPRPGRRLDVPGRPVFRYGTEPPDTEPAQLELTNSPKHTQYAPTIARFETTRHRDPHAQKAAVRMVVADEGEWREGNVRLIEGRARGIVSTQNVSDRIRQIIGSTQECFSPSARDSQGARKVKLTVRPMLTFNPQYDHVRVEHRARDLRGCCRCRRARVPLKDGQFRATPGGRCVGVFLPQPLPS